MNERNRLNSWKEIAAHLQVETRTAMRWEDDRGLPIHRVPGGGRAAVFAYAEEIDAWLHGQPAESQTESPAGETNATAERRMSRGAAIALVSSLAVVILMVFAVTWRGGAKRMSRPERVALVGSQLTVFDASDRELWSQTLPDLLPQSRISNWRTGAERARLADLDGDGRREVLVVAHLDTAPGNSFSMRSELRCYSSEGQLLWQYEPKRTLKFREREFEGPWFISDVVISAEVPRKIWLAVVHNTWWPSFVVELDAAGQESLRFVNSGTMLALLEVSNARGTFLLAGGVNNEPYAATLAVLDVKQPFAVSPQAPGSKFECLECPAGSPVAYFVLPRSELNRVEKHALNSVVEVRRVGQQVQAGVMELGVTGVLGLFEFSVEPDIVPMRINYADSYWVRHREHEQAGDLKHSAEQCPDRIQPKSVRRWTPDAAWTTVTVPSMPHN
ncbi:MAG: hypothetical protein M1453_08535 [Acidobacteria bacterium]|nr:hypothetical protein [Acidobacteriota bacterium]MCL5288022.1 hypothetical protein [Acidobacteriota bacterium]